MSRNTCIGWVLMVVVLAVLSGRVAAEDLVLRFDFSGSIVTTATDTNQDGIPAGLAMVHGESNRGPLTLEALIEWAATPLERAACPQANFQGTLVQGHAVARLQTGDLLYLQPTAGTICLKLPNKASFRLQGEIAGGTGQFTNATGHFRVNATGTALSFAPDGSHGFGGTTGEARARITTREARER